MRTTTTTTMKNNNYNSCAASMGACLCLLSATVVNAWAPLLSSSSSRPTCLSTNTRLYSTVLEKPAAASTTSSSPSSAIAPESLPLSPLTVWGEKAIRPDDLTSRRSTSSSSSSQGESDDLPEFAVEVSALRDWQVPADDVTAQLDYVRQHAMEIKYLMQKHGAVVIRDLSVAKTPDGFVQFYQALGMHPCLDPLHSVAARPTVETSADGPNKKNSPVYEAVNKESRKNFFIGMHNEFVGTRAPRAAAFVCFKAAETGGEFLLADGRRMVRDLDPTLLQELVQRRIRYSVMELPFFGWIDEKLPSFLQGPVMSVIHALATAAINAKVDFEVELLWRTGGGYDQVRMLQARAPPQPPVLFHPVTGEPTWFCNVHSHSSKLRKAREAIYGAERFEEGASQINKSDMFFGDDGELTDEQLKHLDEVTMKNVKFVKMTPGDVVLLDNYKTMHGRNVFDGTRKHAVAWFAGWEGEEEMKAAWPAPPAGVAAA